MSRHNRHSPVDRALFLAAGNGTRIRSRIADRPKPLIRVGGRCLLEWNLDQVARAGVRHVWINLHYRGEQIEREIGDGSRFGLQVHYVHERELLGTAGTARRLAAEFSGTPFLVVYGDNLTVLDLHKMVAYHRERAAQATLAVFDPLRIPNTGMAGGRLVVAADGQVQQFQEGAADVGSWVNAGVYVLEPDVLNFVSDTVPCDFGRDVFPLMLAQDARLFGFAIDGCCLAVDTPAALDRAEVLVQELALREAILRRVSARPSPSATAQRQTHPVLVAVLRAVRSLPRCGWVAVGITIICLVSLYVNARIPVLGDALRVADPALLWLALGVSSLTIPSKAARWRALFPSDRRPGLGLATVALAVGQVVNWALPTRLGDVARLGLGNPHGRTRWVAGTSQGIAFGLGVLIVEKVLDVGMLLCTVLVLVLLVGLPGWMNLFGLVVAGVACGVAILLAVLVTRPGVDRRLRAWTRNWVFPLLPRRLRFLTEYPDVVRAGLTAWFQPRPATEAAAWSVAAWALAAAVNDLVLMSLRLELSQLATAAAAISVLVAVYGAAVVPALPGRIGLFNAVCIVALLPFGVEFERALAFSIALYAVVYVPPLAVGLLGLALIWPKEIARSGGMR